MDLFPDRFLMLSTSFFRPIDLVAVPVFFFEIILRTLYQTIMEQQKSVTIEQKGRAKVTALLEIEKEVQAQWTANKVFEEDAPTDFDEG